MISIQPANRRSDTPASGRLPQRSRRVLTAMRAVWISLGLLLPLGGCTLPSLLTPSTDAAVEDQAQMPAQPSSRPLATGELTRLPPVAADFNRPIRGAPRSAIRLASHDEPIIDPTVDGPAPKAIAPGKKTGPLPMFPPGNDTTQRFPIDLANALALGGANNLQIQFAREKVLEALVDRAEAEAALLPSLRFGIGYNKHDGRIQATEGDVIEAGRNSLFVGGGAGLGDASLAGGASGPSRLTVNFSLADAAFEPLVGRQLHEAEISAEAATTNDSLTDIALAYFDLVEAHALLANANDALKATDEMVRLTTLFAKAGKGSVSEQYRAEAEQARWQQAVEDAQRRIVGRSVELARRLRLDAGVRLVPVDTQLVPVNMLPSGQSVEELVATGLSSRPELARHQSLIEATLSRMRQEQWRPWLPSIQAGASAGTFGGGRSTNFDRQNERSDVDLLAVWELRNLGFGNMVMRRRAAVENRQAEIEAEMMRDRVVSEVVTAAADVESLRRQMRTAQRGIAAANKSYTANLARIREAEGLPIELLQAIRARGEAQNTYSKCMSEFNRAQYRLLRAVGRPLGSDVPPPLEDQR